MFGLNCYSLYDKLDRKIGMKEKRDLRNSVFNLSLCTMPRMIVAS